MRATLPLLALLLLPALLNAATPAELAWQKGQAAMDADRIEEAIGHFQLALRLDAGLAQAHLGLAAAHLAINQERQAVPHLAAYLRARPSHFLIRLHYGELLFRLTQPDEAWRELEQVVREVQEYPRLADDHLVGCHTRLMEIARARGDGYGEHLHRGIGLYLLAKKRSELGDAPSRRAAEELLCKAAAELTVARLLQPDEARPCWYLHGVWSRLAQRQPAQRWLRRAEELAPFSSSLTAAEKRDLYLVRMAQGAAQK